MPTTNECVMEKVEHEGNHYHCCSNCNEIYRHPKSIDGTVFKYCPNCGSTISKIDAYYNDKAKE